jgi:hypothetical protein
VAHFEARHISNAFHSLESTLTEDSPDIELDIFMILEHTGKSISHVAQELALVAMCTPDIEHLGDDSLECLPSWSRQTGRKDFGAHDQCE